MLILETSFTESTDQFKQFLAENNLPNDILWLFEEDTISVISNKHNTEFFVKPSLSIDNEKLMEKYYEFGKQKSLGICFSAFAICDGKLCCSVIIPKDVEDSEFLMFSTSVLKFSFLSDLPTAKSIKNEFQWYFFKLLNFKFEQGCFMVYLPSKNFLNHG